MNKITADNVIEQYIKPLYGFAMNKTRNIDDAEELAQRIVLQVYDVLLKKDNFIDLNSYIFKIAHNVWTRYISEKQKHICDKSINNMDLCETSYFIENKIIENETAGILRREIAYLSAKQREIVVMYYYKNIKIKDISEKLNLSQGTVKWYLFESKKELKKNMMAMRIMGNLGVNPIKLTNIGHSGSPGEKGDPANFLARSISQNIVYASYRKALSINEIAEELGTSPVFIEDEVKELEEYGFLDKTSDNKYLSTVYINEITAEKNELIESINKKYGEILAEKYFAQFLNLKDKFEQSDIYYPDKDFNFLLWTLIPFARKKLTFNELNKINHDEISILRKDGGNNIIFAELDNEIVTSDIKIFTTMERSSDDLNIDGFQTNTKWIGRTNDWIDNKASDYVSLYHFINGNLIENEVTVSAYERLLDKQYLLKEDGSYKVNIVYCKKIDEILNLLPEPSDEIREIARELDDRIYEINKDGQPARMYKIIKYFSQNYLSTIFTYAIDYMLQHKLISLPAENQQKSISTLLVINDRRSFL
ncbi:RNA polymerase sigma factor [Inconstantimicrobium porci]|uniref:RNA polymerase sigma factor n=1 Tax=Inconstantimicrobium porci TaxID=2652291 RepID=UPI00240A604C|nr:sigma-70 family RNA polymerase sigma factor [Inconstantimicrobium porci]MDD6769496.1 sigma-70 family RNA polymerase sigma factor [Inconstantimicrobium porci]